MPYLSASEVTATSVKLQSGDVLPCGLVVWSTGLAPRHFTRSLDVDKNARGQVSDHCRLAGVRDGKMEGSWGVGEEEVGVVLQHYEI